MLMKSMSKDTYAVFSVPQKQFPRAQAAPSLGNTAMLPSDPLILLNTIKTHNKEYDQLGMTQGFTELYKLYTSREHLSYQKLHLEYPCSADGTKLYSLHFITNSEQ